MVRKDLQKKTGFGRNFFSKHGGGGLLNPQTLFPQCKGNPPVQHFVGRRLLHVARHFFFIPGTLFGTDFCTSFIILHQKPLHKGRMYRSYRKAFSPMKYLAPPPMLFIHGGYTYPAEAVQTSELFPPAISPVPDVFNIIIRLSESLSKS